MAVTQLNYPVTGISGDYRNIFPSQRPLNIDFERRDNTIISISESVGNIRIVCSDNFTDLEEGDYVIFSSDGYTPRSVRVITVVSTDTIDVDSVFLNTDATNGFVNYKKAWYLEYRFVPDTTATDAQLSANLLGFNFQIPSNIDGTLCIDCSSANDLLKSDFDISTGIQANLFVSFKVQYRESWKGNRSESWVSPTDDIPIMMVMGTEDITHNTFLDLSVVQSKFYNSYPLLISYIHSNINDGGQNQIKIIVNEYRIDKTLIGVVQEFNFFNVNGLLTIAVDTTLSDDNAAFIEITDSISTDQLQYDPTQYDPSQYA